MCLSIFPLGLDYQSCPTSEDCENNAVNSFWKRASMQVMLGWAAGWLSVCEHGTEGFRDWASGSLFNFLESHFPPLPHSESFSLLHEVVTLS